MKHAPLLGAVLLALAGCSEEGPGTTVYTGNQISDYVAEWDGYAEAFTFDDGSDRVRLRVFADGHGDIRVGDMGLLPHPVDPSAAPWNWARGSVTGTQLRPGFLYPIYEPRVESARIRVGADYRDLSQEWCEAQTPYFVGDYTASGHGCLPDPAQYNLFISGDGSCSVTDSATGQPLSVGCVPVLLCTQPPPCDAATAACTIYACTCDASSCGARDAGYPIRIDAALETEGTKLVGTFATSDGYTRYAIRLTRQ
jgi:hypothetical protein